MVAAAKLRRAQEKIINARPYANEIFVMLSHLVSEFDLATNPFLKKREVKKIALVVVTSDRGLCGAFNSNIIKEAVRYIDEELGPNNISAGIFCVGRKATEFFTKRDYSRSDQFWEVLYKKAGLFSFLKYESALEIANGLIRGYLVGDFDKVVIVFNEFKSIIQQKIVMSQFLPVPIQKRSEKEKLALPNYIYEPNQGEIFNYLLPKHLKAQMWRVLLESNAAEFAAQMTAMDNATTNAKELIRTLNLKYNKERQAAITKEILEIVSGANALKAG